MNCSFKDILVLARKIRKKMEEKKKNSSHSTLVTFPSGTKFHVSFPFVGRIGTTDCVKFKISKKAERAAGNGKSCPSLHTAEIKVKRQHERFTDRSIQILFYKKEGESREWPEGEDAQDKIFAELNLGDHEGIYCVLDALLSSLTA